MRLGHRLTIQAQLAQMLRQIQEMVAVVLELLMLEVTAGMVVLVS